MTRKNHNGMVTPPDAVSSVSSADTAPSRPLPAHLAVRSPLAAALSVSLALSGVPALAGCAKGGDQPASSRDGSGSAAAVAPTSGEGSDADGGTDGADASAPLTVDAADLDFSAVPLDASSLPKDLVDRARSGLVAGGSEKPREEEVLHAAAMLGHMEEKYGEGFSVSSVMAPVADVDGAMWSASLTCESDDYAYEEGDMEVMFAPDMVGEHRTAMCYMRAGSNGEPEMADTFASQVLAGSVRDLLEEATRGAFESAGVSLVSLDVSAPVMFRDSAWEEADAIMPDGDASEAIRLLSFGMLGMVIVSVPDGEEPADVARSAADDVADAYERLGIADGDGSSWTLLVAFDGDAGEVDPVAITASGVEILTVPEDAGNVEDAEAAE